MTINLPPTYEAKKYEDSIYKKWEKAKAFTPKIDKKKKPFSIALPPPNATGTLHLGHATMLAFEDIMIRHHRMKGESTLWLPGTDHAAIATQSVVERKLQEAGIKNPRQKLGRKKLLEEIKKFVAESRDTIRNQVRKMGASCDWTREKYTLDEDMNFAVNTLFKRMHEDGLIYRAGRIVNWDPKMRTTVADDEIEYLEEKTKFYYFKYGPVVISTARPETKFLDKIIVVNPKDKRYKHLIGKEFEVEWIEGKIKAKVIGDSCVDAKLGTGAMTITPAHSLVDFELAQKYKLQSPQIIDFEGRIRKDISKEFGGLPIEEARAKIVEKLEKKGLLIKIDHDYIHNLAVSYRGKGTIEPQVMKQWFIDVNKKVIKWKAEKRSIKEVLQDTIRSKMISIVPNRFEKIYFHWIDNLRDWCISRQIWWGHQIPIWYKTNSEQAKKFNVNKEASSMHLEVLGINGEAKFSETKPKTGIWVRDPDTLDTWFSSALWTFATLGWPKKTKELQYFHPTSVLETGYDILFFWVARMILASTYALRSDGIKEEKSIPFKTVYLHGLIRDRHGKKMSKSNPETCIDPLDMIEKYGTDALRLSLVIGSTPGNDMRLYEEKIAGYRNFVNKIWNAARFALMNIEASEFKNEFKINNLNPADKWILNELQKLIKAVNIDFDKHRYSDAGTKIYDFTWSKYCDWYLEISKGEKNSAVLFFVLKNILKLLHPFVPFITETLWERIDPKTQLINQSWPKFDKKLCFTKESKEIEKIQEIINAVRSIRAQAKVEPVKKIPAIIQSTNFAKTIRQNEDFILRLARLESIQISNIDPKLPQAKKIIVSTGTIYIPLNSVIDLDVEKKKVRKEITEKEKFISNIQNNLKNPAFLNKAPASVIETQKNKLQEEKQLLKKLKEHLKNL